MTDERKSISLRIAAIGHSSLVTDRMSRLLSEVDDTLFVGCVADSAALLDLVDRRVVNTVIMEVHLGDKKSSRAVELLNTIKRSYPRVKVIVFTDRSDDWYRQLFTAFGADYFFDAMNEAELIPLALKKIARSWHGL